jgi:DNA modification methylase
VTILTGDCRDVMASMDANSVDAIVTDPECPMCTGTGWWANGVCPLCYAAEDERDGKEVGGRAQTDRR